MKTNTIPAAHPSSVRSNWLQRALVAMLGLAVVTALPAQEVPITGATGAGSGLTVSIPNGYAQIKADDLGVMTTAGTIRWMRSWNGQEWKFNQHWESLSQNWSNLTGSTTGDQLQSSGSVAPSGCWVLVDEDWKPSNTEQFVSGVPVAAPMVPQRTAPFNRVMAETASDYPAPVLVSVDYATLCNGALAANGASGINTEAYRRINELHVGDTGRYAFNNRSILEKRAVLQLPSGSAVGIYSVLATGRLALAPETNARGFRWMDRAGEWIDYNTQGQVVAFGDRNNNVTWLQRDDTGRVLGVVDANGRVLFSIHYTGALITEVKDYPIAGLEGDLPQRSVKYSYDDSNRLVEVTDVRGNVVRYGYDFQNHITTITDQEGRTETLSYLNNTVKQRIAPDGSATDYVFEYDNVNKQFTSKITGPETGAGRRTEVMTHNRSGKLVRRMINGTLDEEVRYDTGARAEIWTNARGFVTRITRNEFDQVIEIAYPDGSTIKTSYSALHLQPTEVIDQLGVKTLYQYDTVGNLLKKVEAAGTPDERTTEMVRNAAGQMTEITVKGRTEANGTVTQDAVTKLDYDAQGGISRITDAEGHARLMSYNRAGQLAGLTDPLGHKTRVETDAAGNVTKTVNALGHSLGQQYDKVGNNIATTDERMKVVQARYDSLNRLVELVNAVGGIHKTQYNAYGLPVSMTDEDGRTRSAQFDSFLRITKEIDGMGNVTEFGYALDDGTQAGLPGSLSLPTEVKFPTYTQRQRYDALEMPTAQVVTNTGSQGTVDLPSGQTYDKRGLLTSETDANGKVTYYKYDALKRLAEITDRLGGKTGLHYDVRDNLIQVVDAKGNAHKFEYDRNGRTTREVRPMGEALSYRYDANGNMVEHTDPNGNRAVHTFDAADRTVGVKRYAPDGALVRSTTYTWDAASNLTAWSDTDHTRNQTSSAEATYDDANRKTHETVTYPGGYKLSYGYTYSAAGKKTSLTWPDGTNIGYGYSKHGELETVTIPNEGVISVNQFKWTQAAKITYPGGLTREASMDGLLNPERMNVRTAGQSVLDIADTWGKVQELKGEVRTDTFDGVSTTVVKTYSYDDELRLTTVTADTGGLFGINTESYTLDAVANRTAQGSVDGTWLYDSNNRLIRRGEGAEATDYAYDDSGNRILKTEAGNRQTRFVYDAQNRLIEVKDGANNLVARYGYDPLGRRIWKEQYRNRAGDPLAQAVRTYFLYADEGLIAEAGQHITLNSDASVSENGTPAVESQYGPRPGAPMLTGVLFIKTKSSNGQEIIAYYQHNHLQMPVLATDKSGVVVWSAIYEPFGRAVVNTPAATNERPTIDSKLRLPGQIEDEEAGLHYNYFRDYDPDLGRYLQRDPIELEGGVNVYVYVEGNPVNVFDPTGEVGVVGAVIGAGLDLGFQMLIEGKSLECVNWLQVGVAGAMGAVGAAGWNGTFNLSKGSMKASNVVRRYRRAHKVPGSHDVHHWMVEKGGTVGKRLPDRIRNHPANLHPIDRDIHRSIHNEFGPFSRWWHGTPEWAKAAQGSVAGGAIAEVADSECGCNE